MEPSPDSSEEERFENQAGGFLDRDLAEKAAELAVRALERMEKVGNDSKLAAFVDFVRGIDAVKEPHRRICVLTDYLSTLFYLATAMENTGTVCHVFHDGMNTDSRQSTLAEYSTNGGILTATRAIVFEGVTLSQVTDLILYDHPTNAAELQQVLGRFNRLGRRSQLNAYSLVESSTSDRG
jgi:superfamily II DNA/RNA helicase